jgi:hypothetical protein
VDLNLDALKSSISEHLERSDFAIFHHDPGTLDANLVVTWDSETYPDYQMFLETARKLGVRMILFATREFEESEITDAEEELEESEMTREDRRDYAKSLEGFREHIGSICTIELAFQHETHFYLYELRPDWYEEFVGIADEVMAFGPGVDDDEVDSNGGMGGFYSKN